MMSVKMFRNYKKIVWLNLSPLLKKYFNSTDLVLISISTMPRSAFQMRRKHSKCDKPQLVFPYSKARQTLKIAITAHQFSRYLECY